MPAGEGRLSVRRQAFRGLVMSAAWPGRMGAGLAQCLVQVDR